jgi:hypothetical protein
MCTGLKSCSIAENANLRRIEKESFSECYSLKSFYVPKHVEVIFEDCFKKCFSLSRLRFVSGESLKQLIGDSALDEALEQIGFHDISSAFILECEDGLLDFDFPGWSSFADESSHTILVQDIP